MTDCIWVEILFFLWLIEVRILNNVFYFLNNLKTNPSFVVERNLSPITNVAPYMWQKKKKKR